MPTYVDFPCSLGHCGILPEVVTMRALSHNESPKSHAHEAKDNQDLVAYAVSLGRAGLFGNCKHATDVKG